MISPAVENHAVRPPSPHISLLADVQVDQAAQSLAFPQSQEREEESLLSTTERAVSGPHEDEGRSDSRSDTTMKDVSIWRPLHTRPLIIIAFSAWFVALIGALAALYTISEHNQGLFPSTNELQYLWRYTPVAVLTLTTSLWGLVDYDVRVTAPWNDIMKSSGYQPLHKQSSALLLDYIDMLSIKVPLHATYNRHFAALGSSIILVLLQCQTVISAGLLAVSRIEAENQQIPFILTSKFTDSGSINLHDTNNLAHSRMFHTLTGESSFPDGCTDRWAYQTFSTFSHGIATSEVLVDALTYGLSCEPGNMTLMSLGSLLFLNDSHTTNGNNAVEVIEPSYLKFQIGDCELPEILRYDALGTQNGTNIAQWWTISLAEGFVPGNCNSSDMDRDHKRLIVSFSTIEYIVSSKRNVSEDVGGQVHQGMNYTYQATRVRATTLVCAGTYNFTTVRVQTRNNTRQITSVEDTGPPRTLPNFHPWTIIQSMKSITLDVETKNKTNPFPDQLQACDGNCSSMSSWDIADLYNAWNELHQRFAVFYWHDTMFNPANIGTFGTGTIVSNRLVVQDLACHFLIGSLSICLIILVGFGIQIPKSCGFSCRIGSPWSVGMLSGMAWLLSFPRELGGTDLKQLKLEINRPGHTVPGFDPASCPRLIKSWGLRSVSRIGILLYMALLIATLETALSQSERMNGIGDIENDSYLHYAWTTGPAVVLTLLSMAISSVDFQTRMMEPFAFLTQTADLDIIDLDLLRPSWPAILKQEWWSRSFGALATTTTTLVAAWLTIASASLFHELPVPSTSELQIESTSRFVTSGQWCDNRASFPDSSPILIGNQSYPATSYENLVFPELSLDKAALDSIQYDFNNKDFNITATIQALRPSLSNCHLYSAADIETTRLQQVIINDGNTLRTYGAAQIVDFIAVTVRGERLHDCPWRKDWTVNGSGDSLQPAPDVRRNYTATFPMPIFADGQFGAAQQRCSSYLFIWGRHSLNNPDYSSTSVLSCNQTMGEVVSVEMNFAGSNSTLDLARPVQPLNASSIWNSTIRLPDDSTTFSKCVSGVTTSVFDIPLHELYQMLYLNSPATPKNCSFDGFFGQLVTSRYATLMASIGDILQENAVKDAILFQHSIIAAHALDGIGRITNLSALNFPDSEGSFVPVALLSDSMFEPHTFDATVIYENDRLRLIQDKKATRILEGLLALTMVLFLLGWALAHKKPVLPRAPTSIASVLALLAGGDLLEAMYKDNDEEARTTADLKLMLGEDCRVWLGMGPPDGSAPAAGGRKRFGVWVTAGPFREREKPAPARNRESEDELS
ncbi:hypothetical protein PFICI_08877 [Pestalotiopsis fici W106-1]|uniref:Uncharacterized protein n=1 Tax=Pestalotiopsis fici (strain W106-1 / CGMCC3.15140) TaxID=1229662 RepID=W3WZ12_PESFW|nr:uncharacterized protein PFICI_08877 [Pestalotiopsis fici W106-1]ETS79024.1 hypothetical protein PFICI_08877 [Pestalotiopsis fici W106-1]